MLGKVFQNRPNRCKSKSNISETVIAMCMASASSILRIAQVFQFFQLGTYLGLYVCKFSVSSTPGSTLEFLFIGVRETYNVKCTMMNGDLCDGIKHFVKV